MHPGGGGGGGDVSDARVPLDSHTLGAAMRWVQCQDTRRAIYTAAHAGPEARSSINFIHSHSFTFIHSFIHSHSSFIHFTRSTRSLLSLSTHLFFLLSYVDIALPTTVKKKTPPTLIPKLNFKSSEAAFNNNVEPPFLKPNPKTRRAAF